MPTTAPFWQFSRQNPPATVKDQRQPQRTAMTQMPSRNSLAAMLANPGGQVGFNPMAFGSWSYMPTAPSPYVQAMREMSDANRYATDASRYAAELGFLGRALEGPYGVAMAAQQTVPMAQAGMYGAQQGTEQARLGAQAAMYGAQQGQLGQYYAPAAALQRAPYELMAATYGPTVQAITAQNLAQMQNEAQMNRLAAMLQFAGQYMGGGSPGAIQTGYGAGIS